MLARYLNFTLAWIGFGTVLGMVSLIVLPSKDGRGNLATVLMAVAGTIVGCLLLQQLSYEGEWVMPVSAQGFTVGIGGAMVMLMFFKILGSHLINDSTHGIFRHNRRRRRRYVAATDNDD